MSIEVVDAVGGCASGGGVVPAGDCGCGSGFGAGVGGRALI